MKEEAELRSVVASVVREVVREEIAPLEQRLHGVEKNQRHHADKLAEVTHQQAQTAAALAAITQASNAALELARRALETADRSKHESDATLTSALKIVDGKIDAIRADADKRADALATLQREAAFQTSLMQRIDRWQNHPLFRLGLLVGGVIAALLGWYVAHAH